jgi:hypothetical protein
MIPYTDLKAQHHAIKQEIDAAEAKITPRYMETAGPTTMSYWEFFP